jgi:restriction system protein
VKQTPYSSDGGKDAIAMKDGKKVLIECKRYEKDLIGRPALQKFYAAIMEEKAAKGIFVTTSGFARTALEYQYVRSNLIELIDGYGVVPWGETNS